MHLCNIFDALTILINHFVATYNYLYILSKVIRELFKELFQSTLSRNELDGKY